MIYLSTKNGLYNLSAVARIDIPVEENTNGYDVYINLDNWKHYLHSFESHRDVVVFTQCLNADLTDALYPDEEYNDPIYLTDLIDNALDHVETIVGGFPNDD